MFGWFGQFVGVAGGTALQLAVPALLAAHFTVQRDVQGTTFCIFTFFEQWLPISKYMADARAQALPLLTVGDSDVVIHDWNYLLTRCGCLAHDVQIAHVVHFVGWLGMLATIAWMVVQSLWATPSSAPPSGDPQATHGPAVA